MLLSSYSSAWPWPLDHDEGSAYYEDSENFMLYGGYKPTWDNRKS